MSKSMKWVMTISLVMNLLFVGILGGHAFRDVLHPHATRGFMDIADGLSEEAQQRFGEMMEANKTQMDAARREMDEAKDKASVLLKAQPFDKQAYLKQTAKLNELRGKMMQNMTKSMADFAAQSTQEDRALLAEKLSKFRK